METEHIEHSSFPVHHNKVKTHETFGQVSKRICKALVKIKQGQS